MIAYLVGGPLDSDVIDAVADDKTEFVFTSPLARYVADPNDAWEPYHGRRVMTFRYQADRDRF